MQQGRQEGKQEGQKFALEKILIAQLEKKFRVLSDADRQRITSADPDTLLRWGERLIIAGSLKEVFD
ncbi:transposase [bacterium]|nr:transposase [bacterium]